jgi:hypothetical protein
VSSGLARCMRTRAGGCSWTSGLLGLLLLLSAGHAGAEDGWIADSNGCKISDPSPKPGETVTWSGPCVDGFAQGQGIVQWYENDNAGVRYQGTLARGAASGQGKLTMPDGTTYEGGWRDGKQQGTGRYSAPGGTRYEGEWKDGAPDGRGIMHGPAGEVMDGIWKGGSYVGPAPEQ